MRGLLHSSMQANSGPAAPCPDEPLPFSSVLHNISIACIAQPELPQADTRRQTHITMFVNHECLFLLSSIASSCSEH